MGILSECPACRRKQSNRIKNVCVVRAWIRPSDPGAWNTGSITACRAGNNAGKRGGDEGSMRQFIEDARTALSKRIVQKKEKRVLDMLPESQITFNDLADWYFRLEKVMALKSYDTVCVYINKFNRVFGDIIVADIKPADLESLQTQTVAGRSERKID